MAVEPMDFKAMSQEDAQAYYTLWHKTRDPLYLYNAKIAARCYAVLVAFREARDHDYTFFLGTNDTIDTSVPYTWFNTSTTWAVWARAHHTANTTGKVVYVYLQGDFQRTYAKVHPKA